jgi:catalase (peroxidase I)
MRPATDVVMVETTWSEGGTTATATSKRGGTGGGNVRLVCQQDYEGIEVV